MRLCKPLRWWHFRLRIAKALLKSFVRASFFLYTIPDTRFLICNGAIHLIDYFVKVMIHIVRVFFSLTFLLKRSFFFLSYLFLFVLYTIQCLILQKALTIPSAHFLTSFPEIVIFILTPCGKLLHSRPYLFGRFYGIVFHYRAPFKDALETHFDLNRLQIIILTIDFLNQ